MSEVYKDMEQLLRETIGRDLRFFDGRFMCRGPISRFSIDYDPKTNLAEDLSFFTRWLAVQQRTSLFDWVLVNDGEYRFTTLRLAEFRPREIPDLMEIDFDIPYFGGEATILKPGDNLKKPE